MDDSTMEMHVQNLASASFLTQSSSPTETITDRAKEFALLPLRIARRKRGVFILERRMNWAADLSRFAATKATVDREQASTLRFQCSRSNWHANTQHYNPP